MCPAAYLLPYVCLCWDCRPIWYRLRPTASPLAATVEPPYCHTRNTLTGRQGAAHSDAAGNVPLAVAARVGAAEEVKQVLFEGHRGAVAEKALWDVVQWGEGAVRSVLEARPEVSRVGSLRLPLGTVTQGIHTCTPLCP